VWVSFMCCRLWNWPNWVKLVRKALGVKGNVLVVVVGVALVRLISA